MQDWEKIACINKMLRNRPFCLAYQTKKNPFINKLFLKWASENKTIFELKILQIIYADNCD